MDLYNIISLSVVSCVSSTCFAVWLIVGFIIETGKSPVVGLFFLNMWGDCQVVPYYPRRTLSFGSEGTLEYAIKGERNLRAQQQKTQSPSSSPQHYAIVVDETQIKVSFKKSNVRPSSFFSFCSHLVFLVSTRSVAVLHPLLRKV